MNEIINHILNAMNFSEELSNCENLRDFKITKLAINEELDKIEPDIEYANMIANIRAKLKISTECVTNESIGHCLDLTEVLIGLDDLSNFVKEHYLPQ